jgi:hypothetical protein
MEHSNRISEAASIHAPLRNQLPHWIGQVVRRTLPRSRITWIEGNHEFRLRKYLIERAKELYSLPGLSVPDIFDLKRLDIEYVACHELAS